MVTVNNIARGLQKEFFWLVVGFAAMMPPIDNRRQFHYNHSQTISKGNERKEYPFLSTGRKRRD
jgi:hypothetical protein